MKKIIFNNAYTFALDGYSHNYNFNTTPIRQQISIGLLKTNASTVASLAEKIIDTITIIDDDEILYELSNINGKIDAVTEQISYNNQVVVNVVIQVLNEE